MQDNIFPIIYSNDGVLAGSIEYRFMGSSTAYIARIWDLRGRSNSIVAVQSFGNGVSTEDWMLGKLECPLFTLLSK